MRRISRVAIIHASLVAFVVALIAKAAQVQLWEGRAWAAKAERQHLARTPELVPRGPILDATGAVLVESRRVVQIRVAPREVKDRRALGAALARAGVPAPWVRRATDTAEKWVELPGHYVPSDVAAILATPGVHPEPLIDREPNVSAGLQPLIGRIGSNGVPPDGLEEALDTVLRGDAGRETLTRDARGTQFAAPGDSATPARDGNTVVLTINHALQEICERALAEAVTGQGASGGDIVVVDPHDGAVLAMATRRADPRLAVPTALTEPFEPGSTIKPFIAAALLALGKARPTDTIDTHNGSFELNGRRLTDEHKAARMTLQEVIRLSSNIGIAQFAERLTPAQEYQALRDIGFGMPTGTPYPSESPGTLRPPVDWSKQSPASLAIGYEVAVTPLQLALAYAAIANGGELLEPGLIREIRRADGTVVYRHTRRVVRRVMPSGVSATVRDMLSETVAHGTGAAADLSTFAVAGKTGTARRTAPGRGYVPHAYTATFVGLFPAHDPQYVILVKINDPPARGEEYFAAKTAAPLSKNGIGGSDRGPRCGARPLGAGGARDDARRRRGDRRHVGAERDHGGAAVGTRAAGAGGGAAARAGCARSQPARGRADAASGGIRGGAHRGAGRDDDARRAHGGAGRIAGSTRRGRAVTPVARRAVARALADAGVLVTESPALPAEFRMVTDDSRAVETGALFVAVRGSARDGHDYLATAERAGATGAIVDDPARTSLPAFVVRDTRPAAAAAAAAAYGFPARALRAVGVTGTNGKSTSVALLRHLLDEPQARSASLGTVGVFLGAGDGESIGETGLTTPGPIALQQLLRELVDRGVRTLAMEASSHSLDQHRIDGMPFDAALFTNLTQDHLDYHGTMDAYFAAKARLVSYLTRDGAAIVNADDRAWAHLPPAPRTITFSAAGGAADVRATRVRFAPRGSAWDLILGSAQFDVALPLIGAFNVENALGAAGAAWALGWPPDVIAERLQTVPQIPGRLEILHERPTVLRDYAHTPDAIVRALEAVRPFTHGRLIIVVGAGGDRDRGKRPAMGAVSERLADAVILTSDNPRTEDPERILDEIEAGMSRPHERIEDRERAIARAIALAAPDDVIVLAGKGHETYQVRGTTAYPFDERAIVRGILR